MFSIIIGIDLPQQLQETERQRVDLPSAPTTEPTVPVAVQGEVLILLSCVPGSPLYSGRSRSWPCSGRSLMSLVALYPPAIFIIPGQLILTSIIKRIFVKAEPGEPPEDRVRTAIPAEYSGNLAT